MLTAAVFAAGVGQALAAPKSVQGPIFDPRTGSYFQIEDRLDVHNQGPNWREANALAAERRFEGRPGRLAQVRDRETLEFIKKNFELDKTTWTGLRYFCRFRKLVWTTGETQPIRSLAGMWAPQWHRTNITCTNNNIEYMPVYLTRLSEGPARFQASGIQKRFPYVLIEFPEKDDDVATSGAEAPTSGN